jgi:hypothetical protein
MTIQQIIAHLRGERDRLNQAIAVLEAGATSGKGRRGGPRRISAAGRRRISEAMKRRWAARKKAKAAAA